MAYYGDGHLTQTISANGFTTWQYYDGEGHLTKTLEADSASIGVDYTYDAMGRIQMQKSYRDPDGTNLVATTTKTYDGVGCKLFSPVTA
jgi:YD repeat-containing protein